jgi:hypothetical protein
MTLSPREIGTARRNLAGRIARFIDRLERERRDPNRLEGDYVLSALGHLAVDQGQKGEEAMMHAERAELATPQDIARVRVAYEPVTTKHLRAQLASILKRKA